MRSSGDCGACTGDIPVWSCAAWPLSVQHPRPLSRVGLSSLIWGSRGKNAGIQHLPFAVCLTLRGLLGAQASPLGSRCVGGGGRVLGARGCCRSSSYSPPLTPALHLPSKRGLHATSVCTAHTLPFTDSAGKEKNAPFYYQRFY